MDFNLKDNKKLNLIIYRVIKAIIVLCPGHYQDTENH